MSWRTSALILQSGSATDWRLWAFPNRWVNSYGSKYNSHTVTLISFGFVWTAMRFVVLQADLMPNCNQVFVSIKIKHGWAHIWGHSSFKKCSLEVIAPEYEAEAFYSSGHAFKRPQWSWLQQKQTVWMEAWAAASTTVAKRFKMQPFL